jgi:siroheme synthase
MAERVVFDRSLYLPEAVEAAAAVYADYAKIEVTRRDNSTDVVISDGAEHDAATIAPSFCNHVLHETIALRRQDALAEGA